MKLSQDHIDIITSFEYLLKQDNFDKFYLNLLQTVTSYSDVGQFTDFFMVDCGIHLFEYLTKLPKALFCGSKQKVITIPDKYNSIPDRCFNSTELCEVELPENLLSIESYVFGGPNIKEIKIPPKVCFISDMAFGYAFNLEKIFISKFTFDNSKYTVRNSFKGEIKLYD